jgi:hypothetical protein
MNSKELLYHLKFEHEYPCWAGEPLADLEQKHRAATRRDQKAGVEAHAHAEEVLAQFDIETR